MKILVADGDAIGRLLVSRYLCLLGYEVVTATGGDEAWDILKQSCEPQIAIIDWDVKGLSLARICEHARAGSIGHHIIAMASRVEENQADYLMKTGCDDYLFKPLDAFDLKTRLALGCRILELKRRLAEAERPEEFEASHDRLTGLWNRAAILEFLAGQFARSGRDGISLAVAMADLDSFSAFNEHYGRKAGDDALRQLATRMRRVIRPYDWLGRFDEDSFLIIAPDCTLSNGFAMCERLRSVVSDTVMRINGAGHSVTMSVGVATSAESGAMSEDALLRAAESALVQAKQNGRNRVEAAKRSPRPQKLHVRTLQPHGQELIQ